MPTIREPHVEKIVYQAFSSRDIKYKNPPAVEFEELVGKFRLANGMLTVDLIEHFDSIEDAKLAIEGILKAWEIQSDISGSIGGLRFSYSSATVVDRAPPDDRPRVTLLAANEEIRLTDKLFVEQVRNTYPAPPIDFVTTPLVESVARRWMRQLEGHEPLQASAYFILTVIESSFGGRNGAASALKIDKSVLSKLGELTSIRGDSDSARKATAQLSPLTQNEDRWIRAAVVEIIRRLGRPNSAPQVETLTLPGLPEL
jgi:hypothetical protein